MDHVAILSKEKPWLEWIRTGKKTIESRWYKTRRTPYGRVKKGDRIFFKESGAKITVQATVEKVHFFADFTKGELQEIINTYGDSICLQKRDPKAYAGLKYCTLIELDNVREVEPFQIDKTGFGSGVAWITVADIEKIKQQTHATSHEASQQRLAPS